jgi:predicted RNA-binding Zn ribbon-like protein
VGDNRDPAPGELGLVQDFINTIDLEDRTEELSSPERLAAWLEERGLLEGSAPCDGRDLWLAHSAREALRELAFVNNDGAAAEEAWKALNAVATEAELHVAFSPEGAQLEPGVRGVPGALGRLLALVYEAMQDGTWSRFKACRDEGCRWVFYDHSKNRSGAWCTMASCGNRAKTRSYRRRSKAASA